LLFSPLSCKMPPLTSPGCFVPPWFNKKLTWVALSCRNGPFPCHMPIWHSWDNAELEPNSWKRNSAYLPWSQELTACSAIPEVGPQPEGKHTAFNEKTFSAGHTQLWALFLPASFNSSSGSLEYSY
jgi:hypothetical protein